MSDSIADDLLSWVEQLDIDTSQVMKIRGMVGYSDLLDLKIDGHSEQRDAPHIPEHHSRF